MTKDEIYADFLALTRMNAPLATKCTMLGWLLKHAPNWVVIGVTPAALQKFARLDFRYEPRNGLERAHPISRSSTYTRLIEDRPDPARFWEILHQDDRTILCDNSADHRENAQIAQLPFYRVPEGLFAGKRVGWVHGSEERAFLRDLFERREEESLISWRELVRR